MGRLVWFSQILCLCFMLLHFQIQCSSLSPNSTPHLCRPQEKFAMLDFKNTISAGNCDFGRRTIQTWNGSLDCCLWEGITCNKMTGHVVGLDLSQSCIAANLTTNSSLFHLEKLQSLNLALNDLSYPNRSFGFHIWKSLTYLNLTDTGLLDNSILFEISLLPKLVSLDLSKNYDLHLQNMMLQMLVHNLTALRSVFLDYGNMSSVLPSAFLNLTSSLERLSLRDCSMQGNFPSQVFQLPSLQLLDISTNTNLKGNLPKSNWSSPLKYLSLYGTSFSGELPHSLGNLKLLQELLLDDCQFYGSIPRSLANLTEVTYLSLGDNHLEGQLSNDFGKMHKLSILYLNANNFDGELPASIFTLTRLTNLDLSSNKLTSALPSNVSGLLNLSFLSMSHNFLKGQIPSWLFSLPSLFSLDLSYNSLTDLIDHIQKPNMFLKEVDLSNNKISGSIPIFFFDLVNLTEVNLSSNNLSGTITPNMLSKLVNLGVLDLSSNSFLSLSNNGTSISYTFPNLVIFRFSSCNIHKFPSFLVKSRSLIILDLSNNKISGQIQKQEIEGLTLNTLNLSYNFLNGIDLFAIDSVLDIDLRSNLLQGSLPIPPETVRLLVSKNYLSGEIPPSLCNVSSLFVLDLSWNSFRGKIPECLGKSHPLSILDLRMNKFHGRIPNLIVNSSVLLTLNLNGNQLEGTLPPYLANCSSLEVLDVGKNCLKDTFPHWLGVLPSLRVLVLRFNRFHGPISNSMPEFYFPQLRIIDVSHNDFIGLLPSNYFKNLKAMRNVHLGPFEQLYIGDYGYYEDSVVVVMKGLVVELGKILRILTTIDFSSNRFHGEIPEDLGELNSLHLLNFSNNNLTGQIPSSLGKITELEALDLSSNELDGKIPEQLTNLTFLSVLNLSYNELVDHIPQGKQFDTFSNDSYIGNSGLCGLPLTKKCNKGKEPEAPPSQFEDESAPIFDWKFALMGYGCGLVLGVSLGYIVFTTGRPWWLVKRVEMYQQKFVEGCNPKRKIKRKIQQPN